MSKTNFTNLRKNKRTIKQRQADKMLQSLENKSTGTPLITMEENNSASAVMFTSLTSTTTVGNEAAAGVLSYSQVMACVNDIHTKANGENKKHFFRLSIHSYTYGFYRRLVRCEIRPRQHRSSRLHYALEKKLRLNDLALAATLNNIGQVYQSMGKYKQALPFHQEAVEIAEKSLSLYHPKLATFYNNLASLHSSIEEI